MSNEELAGQRIELSTHLTSFAANDPGDWTPMFDRARLLEQAGFDRLVVSDHVVFGENINLRFFEERPHRFVVGKLHPGHRVTHDDRFEA